MLRYETTFISKLLNRSVQPLSTLCFHSFIANAGDARAVLGVQEEDGSFTAHTLSNDHSAQNESEVARIRSEHPPSERKTVIRQVVLCANLMRSFMVKQI